MERASEGLAQKRALEMHAMILNSLQLMQAFPDYPWKDHFNKIGNAMNAPDMAEPGRSGPAQPSVARPLDAAADGDDGSSRVSGPALQKGRRQGRRDSRSAQQARPRRRAGAPRQHDAADDAAGTRRLAARRARPQLRDVMAAKKTARKGPDPRLKRAGVSGFNKPKRTPGHPTKSHIVVARSGGKVKTIRFGEQGAKTNQNAKQRKAFKDRHRKNIAKGPMSAAYWANKVKWKGCRSNSTSTRHDRSGAGHGQPGSSPRCSAWTSRWSWSSA